MPKLVFDIEAAASQLRPFLPQYLQEKGIDTSSNFRCINPSHEDRNPSMSLILKDPSNPRAYCHSCGARYDLFDAVQILEKRPTTGLEWIEDTLKYLANKYQVEVQVGELSEEQAYELDTYRAYRLAASLIRGDFGEQGDDPRLERYWKAVEARGWTTEVMTEQGVGTVLDFLEFKSALKEAGFSAGFLDEIDLGRKELFNPDNLIFTWFDEKSRPIGFTARNLLYETEKKKADKEGRTCKISKYNNQRTTGLRCNIFQKGKRLYGIDKAIKATPPLYIFEGQADVITARQHGLVNCVALGGSSLSTDHVLLMKELNCYDIILSLDSDTTGQTKQDQILEERLSGHKDLRVRLVELPEGEDPDSFIRNKGIEAFRELTIWSAFEWRLNRYPEEEDPVQISKQMIPFIVNEPSPIEREQLCKTLARRTGTSLKAIQEELDVHLNAQKYEREKERGEIIERATYELKRNPTEAENILQHAAFGLTELSKKYDKDALSSESFLAELEAQKVQEEKLDDKYNGFELGPDLRNLQDTLMGEWSKDVLMLLGSRENAGKSALLCKIAYSIATNNNATVIYHTIDDTRPQLLPRFVCLAEGSRRLTINQVRNPRYWDALGSQYPECQDVLTKRQSGYETITRLAREGRLIIKDMNDGTSLSYIDKLIAFHQDKHPERPVVFIFDNLHKVADFGHFKEERSQYKAISQRTKEIASNRHVAFLSSVEYTKLGVGIRPTNHNIAESVAFSYDANYIIHLYSELADIPDKYTLCHKDIDWRGELIPLPRIEVSVGKNKVSEVKTTFYLDFWPASSDYRSVSLETVASDQEAMKRERQARKRDDDPFAGTYQR